MTEASVLAVPGGAAGHRWRRPPSAPAPGRSLTLRARLGYSLTIGLVVGIPPDGNLLARLPVPAFAIPIICIAGLGFAYGIAVIATARSGRVGRRLWAGVPFGANPVSRVWWGLAFVVGLPVSYAAGILWPPSPTTPGMVGVLLWCSGTLAAFGCLMVSVACSNIEVKRSIRSGRAPTYRLSRDQLSWWDGDGWTSVQIAAPAGAVRSPDGTYWWSGDRWVGLPPGSGRG